MATAAPTMYCPECGALVKAGDKECWMCSRTLRVTVKVAAGAPPPQFRYETNAAASWKVTLAAVAMVPAAMVGFFVTCSAAIGVRPYQRYPDDADILTYLLSGCAGAFIVCVGFGVLIASLRKRTVRKIPV